VLLYWLFVLPIVTGVVAIWNEQWSWHANYAAVHRLFQQSEAWRIEQGLAK